MMESLTLGASIIGLMVVGAMTASMIDLTIPITISGSGKMQSRFKVSLTISCLNYYRLHLLVLFLFIEKEVKPLAILGGMAIVGILGSLIGLF